MESNSPQNVQPTIEMTEKYVLNANISDMIDGLRK